MKITFFLTQDLNSPSGLGRYFPWAKELSKLNHEIKIFALHSNYSSVKNKFENINGVEVHYIGQMHVRKFSNSKVYFGSLTLLALMISATIKFIYYSLFDDYNVLIIGKPHPMNGIASIFSKIVRRKNIIVDCDDDETHSGNFKKSWQKLVICFFEKKIPKIADVVTTNTKYTEQRLIKDGISKEKIFYLTNGVDPDRFTNIEENRLFTLRRELGLENKKVVAYLGSMSLASHAINLLIDAFEEIVKENTDIMMLLVGGGEDFDYIQKIVNKKGIKSRTVFTGRVNSDDIKYYYKLADITVDPVYNDIAAKARSPLKIFESWACGVPVLTSKVGDRNELFRDNFSCLRVSDNETPLEIKNAILIFFMTSSFDNHQCSDLSKRYFWDKLIKSLIDNNEKLFGKYI